MQSEDQDQIQEQEQDQEVTSVEIEDAEVVSADSDSDETRTNVQDDEELDNYSKKVDKRIAKLTAARRQAEEEAAAAVQYIQQVQTQNDQYKQRLATLDKGYMSEYEGRITTQEAQAKEHILRLWRQEITINLLMPRLHLVK